MWQDLRFGARLLRRTPALTLTAALSLGLGVGANTAIFTVVKAVFLEPLAVADPATLIAVFRTLDTTTAGAGATAGLFPASFANYEDLAARSTSLLALTASGVGQFNLADEGEPEQVAGSFVTTNYFDVLGLRAAGGRFFLPEEERQEVVVVSHGLWQRRYGFDPLLVGKSIQVNGRSFTVIGIAPRGFTGTFTLGNLELWVPVHLYPRLVVAPFASQVLEHRGFRFFALFGRLHAGVSAARAEAGLATVAEALEREHPEWNRGRGVRVLPIQQSTLDPNQRALFVRAGAVLMGAVGLVLVIACANVANLLLARGRARHKEVAMRLSLGASRGRLVRQLLTESLLLATLGAGLGVALALVVRPLLWSLRPPFVADGSLDLALDLPVLGFTTLVTVTAGLLFGLAPALQAARTDLMASARSATSLETDGGRRAWLRQGLVVAQVALSMLALAAAGLFLRSLANAHAIDPGFDHRRLLVASFDLGAQGYSPEEIRAAQERLRQSVESLPGVESAGLSSSAPLSFTPSYRVLPVGDEERVGPEGVYVNLASVTEGYFQSMGIPLLEGRVIDERDRVDGRQVVVVNRTMAEQFWPDGAVGRQLRWPAAEQPWNVVGVVADHKYVTLGEGARPFFFRPLTQEENPALTLHVRTGGAPQALLDPVVEEIRRLEPSLPVLAPMAVEEALRQSLWAAAIGAKLLGVFGLLALLLAAVGIYGLLTQICHDRRRELGIRLALGAERRTLVRHVLGHGMTPVALGLALGCGLALAALRSARGLLYDLSGSEPTVLLAAALALAGVAAVACTLPALRAAQVDPVVTLKVE